MSCSHIGGHCPAEQEAKLKRRHQQCVLLAEEIRKKDWRDFNKLPLRDHQDAPSGIPAQRTM